MEQKIEYTLLQYSQPNLEIWNSIRAFVATWNQTQTVQFVTSQALEYSIYFSPEDGLLKEDLHRQLSLKAATEGWVYYISQPQNLNVAAIENHDFIELLGGGYPEEFISNVEEVLKPIQPCAGCGTEHPHLREQTGSFRINEALLHARTLLNSEEFISDIDLINTPNGGLLVTKKVAEILRQHPEIEGYALIEVLDEKDQVSTEVFQLMAQKIILVSEGNAGKICPLCGSVLDQLDSPFSIPFQGNETLQFFSRAPQGFASLFVKNSIYHLFKEQNLGGIVPASGVNFSSAR